MWEKSFPFSFGDRWFLIIMLLDAIRKGDSESHQGDYMRDVFLNRRDFCKAIAAGGALLAGAAAFSGCATTTSEQAAAQALSDDGTGVYTLVYASNNSANAAMYKNVEHELLQRIHDATNGRIVINEYLASALTKAGEGRNAVLNDICDIVFDSPSWYSGTFPLTTLTEMPLGFKSGKALSFTLRDLIQKYKPAEYEGFKVLCPMSSGPRCLISNTPVRQLEDMKNLQVRASATSAAIVRSWGAVPTTISSSDVYEALQNNLVDSGLFSYESMAASHYYDICDYLTDLSPVSTNVVIYMSQEKFDALPKDLQEIIEKVCSEFFEEVGASFWAEYREDAVAVAKAGNSNFQWFTLDDDETQRWVDASASLTESYVQKATDAGYDGPEVLEWIKSTYAAYEKLYPAK